MPGSISLSEVDDLVADYDAIPDSPSLSGLDELEARGAAVPRCFPPFGLGSIWWHSSLVHAVEKLHASVRSSSGCDFHLVGSCYRPQVLDLMVARSIHELSRWCPCLDLMKHSAGCPRPGLAAEGLKLNDQDGLT